MSQDTTKCAFPGCERRRQATGRRGSESPIVAAGGDTSIRSKWCMYHRKGSGKKARIAYTAKLMEAK